MEVIPDDDCLVRLPTVSRFWAREPVSLSSPARCVRTPKVVTLTASCFMWLSQRVETMMLRTQGSQRLWHVWSGSALSQVCENEIFYRLGNLTFFGTRPNWVVSYIAYTKFHSPRPVFDSPGQIFTRGWALVSQPVLEAHFKWQTQAWTNQKCPFWTNYVATISIHSTPNGCCNWMLIGQNQLIKSLN